MALLTLLNLFIIFSFLTEISSKTWMPGNVMDNKSINQNNNGEIKNKKNLNVLATSSSTSTKKIITSSSYKKCEEEHPLAWLPNGVKNGMASGLAAAVVKTILQPFDTVKTVQQAQMMRVGPIGAAKDVIAKRGILGLWSGIGVTIIGSSPSVAVYFGCYSAFKERFVKILPPEYKLVAVACSAMLGNTIASVLRVPYEVLKQRMQYGLHATAWEALTHSIKHEGPLGLFSQGKLASQIIRDVPYAVVTLMSYELLQQYFIKKQQEKINRNEPIVVRAQAMTDALCGSMAGGIGTVVTTPMDVIKTRMMTTKTYSGVIDASKRILKEEGAATFLVGVYPRLMHKIPANGLFFLCYEKFRVILGVDHTAVDVSK